VARGLLKTAAAQASSWDGAAVSTDLVAAPGMLLTDAGSLAPSGLKKNCLLTSDPNVFFAHGALM
jgi:hypothetical protein